MKYVEIPTPYNQTEMEKWKGTYTYDQISAILAKSPLPPKVELSVITKMTCVFLANFIRLEMSIPKPLEEIKEDAYILIRSLNDNLNTYVDELIQANKENEFSN